MIEPFGDFEADALNDTDWPIRIEAGVAVKEGHGGLSAAGESVVMSSAGVAGCTPMSEMML